MASSAGLEGCKKAEELAGKVSGDDEEETKSDDAADAESDAKTDDAEAKKDDEVAKAEPEPIPVAPMRTGLDPHALVRARRQGPVHHRARCLGADRVRRGATRFLEGPISKLAENPPTPDFQQAQAGFEMFKTKSKEIVDALGASGLHLEHGGAIIKTAKGKSLLVFSADSPDAITDVAKALGEKDIKADQCKAIDGMEGWNVCADDKATLDGYKPAEDPSAVRTALADKLKGIELDDANVLVNLEDNGGVVAAVNTLPGLVEAAMVMPDDKDTKEALAALAPATPKALANVQPGAGFIWVNVKPEAVDKIVADGAKGAPPEVAKMLDSLSGEWLLAGSVNPGGLFFQAGMTDTSTFAPVLELALKEKDGVPSELPDVKGSKVTVEKVSIEAGGGQDRRPARCDRGHSRGRRHQGVRRAPLRHVGVRGR